MAKDTTKIAKIVLNIAGEEIELSPKQAKELRDILSEMYPGENKNEYHYHYPRPYSWPYATWTCTSNISTIDCSAGTTLTSGYANSSVSGNTVYLAAA